MTINDLGYIYVAQMDGHPLYKIGRSNNVPRRMSEIGIQLPYPYRLCFAHRVKNVHFTESDLHKDFSYYRRNGEWFELPDQGVALIKAKLLWLQVDQQIVRVFQRCLDEPFNSESLERFGRLLIKLSRRLERRLTVVNQLQVELYKLATKDDVLEAEIVL